ncbi:hypothetical protein O181_049335 [Austropuccinia psidii MF-1]|uniref:Uncharacterized protein n=1 Tax=Austropuccinia psidii MF-1 TaxID=1389203 RepID=A0A9Q3HPY8_9BASI|nr:hypothetical protein [Austropuccinia psidii MF-1]
MSVADRLHQKILEMQEQLLALIKREGKNKSSSFILQNSPPFQDHSGNMNHLHLTQDPWPHQHLLQKKTKYLTNKAKIRAKDYNLWFNEKDFERFIKKVENIAEIEGESGRDIARQIEFWTKDEGIPGYETADWDQLKVEMKRRWATFTRERRYRLSSITELFTKTQQEGGIRNMTHYRKFIGEYEQIITYLKRYQYIQGDIKHHQEILASLSTSVEESIQK